MEEVIDELIEKLKDRHIGRLCIQECTPQSGIIFLELLTNFERIGDHCFNIALETIQRNDKKAIADTHKYVQDAKNHMDDDYKADFEEFLKRYSV